MQIAVATRLRCRLRYNWVGAKWVIKADISNCFERIDHHRLLDILREKIADNRLINLIRKFLKAGYLENWQYHKTVTALSARLGDLTNLNQHLPE